MNEQNEQNEQSEQLARIRWQFTRQAEAYARMRQATDEAAFRRLITFCDAQPEHAVLDVACGPAFMTLVFAAHCRAVTGFDATDRFLALARAEAARRGLANVQFDLGDAEHLPYPDGSFDRVLCRAALHHLLHPARVLAEMKRVLRPAGRMLVLDMLTADDDGRAAYHNRIERLCDPTHTRALAAREFDALYRDCDLQLLARTRQTIDYHSVDEWLEHGDPWPAAASAIVALMEASLNRDRCGLNVRREDGRLRFSHTVVADVPQACVPAENPVQAGVLRHVPMAG